MQLRIQPRQAEQRFGQGCRNMITDNPGCTGESHMELILWMQNDFDGLALPKQIQPLVHTGKCKPM